jgi:hypothetical protein
MERITRRNRSYFTTLMSARRHANALAHLATSFIYVYASRSNEYKTALDSAYYYADKGLRMTSHENDAASLLMAEAFAYLLKDEVEKAIDACRTVREQHPEINKETLLRELQFFKRNITGSTANIQRMEDYIKRGE